MLDWVWCLLYGCFSLQGFCSSYACRGICGRQHSKIQWTPKIWTLLNLNFWAGFCWFLSEIIRTWVNLLNFETLEVSPLIYMLLRTGQKICLSLRDNLLVWVHQKPLSIRLLHDRLCDNARLVPPSYFLPCACFRLPPFWLCLIVHVVLNLVAPSLPPPKSGLGWVWFSDNMNLIRGGSHRLPTLCDGRTEEFLSMM
jgi:hypothetical protein